MKVSRSTSHILTVIWTLDKLSQLDNIYNANIISDHIPINCNNLMSNEKIYFLIIFHSCSKKFWKKNWNFETMVIRQSDLVPRFQNVLMKKDLQYNKPKKRRITFFFYLVFNLFECKWLTDWRRICWWNLTTKFSENFEPFQF